MIKIKFLAICLLGCFIFGMLWGTTVGEDLKKETHSIIPSTLFLKGSPYELGYQHGQRLKKAIAYNVKRFIDDKILANSDHPQIKSFLDAIPQVLEHIPDDYLKELKGLAEGAQLPYEKILLLNLFPEMFHCSGLIVKGQATSQQKLYHVRVLDYAVGLDLQDTAVLMVVQPKGKIPFLNVSYAGFIGCVTGMNSQHIAIGEIGGKGYGQYNGIPMSFLLRMTLEKSQNLQEVKEFLASSSRTCEYYYLFSDGKNGDSLGVYATSQQLEFFEPGVSYAIFDHAVISKDPVLSPADDKKILNGSQIEIAPFQTLLYKDQQQQELWGMIHQQPTDCLILTGFSYPKRYPILVTRLVERYGKITVTDLQEIIKGEAGRPSNLHTAIFSPTTLDAWIAHAGLKGEPAWSQPYTHFNLSELLQENYFDSR